MDLAVRSVGGAAVRARRDLLVCAAVGCAVWLIAGCGGRQPEHVGLGPLAACPPTPNCVSSQAAADSDAFVAPFVVTAAPEAAWAATVDVVAGWPRTRVVASTPDALHAESKSALLRFVDDLELRLDAARARIDVRSASRLGRSDLGVNRRRVEALRAALAERGVVRAAGAAAETSSDEAPPAAR